MEMTKLEYYQHAKNSTFLKVNGRVFQVYNILDLEHLQLFMASTSIHSEGIQVKIKEIEQFNHTVTAIVVGENYHIDFIKG